MTKTYLGFSRHWEEVICRLVKHEQVELIVWLQEYVLFWDEGGRCWNAHWRTGFLSAFGARSSAYLVEAWEAHWHALKDALPLHIAHKEPTTAIQKLTAACEAVAVQRKWVVQANT